MPAIITHDFFGRGMLEEFEQNVSIGESVRKAFLLGNQGPDPLFYVAVNPATARYSDLGSRMHSVDPARIFHAWCKVVAEVSAHERHLVRAFAAGFVCHYLLDSMEHPFIYSQEYALCDAGVEGLTRKDGSEVHAVIESELDEMVLYTRTGLTVADFAPQREILQLSDKDLRIVSAAFAEVIGMTFYEDVPDWLYAAAVKQFRIVQGVFHSPTGMKRTALGTVEQAVRPHSFVRAMMPRPVAAKDCAFSNSDHAEWTCPFTGRTSTDSFEDIFLQAKAEALVWLPMLFDSAAPSLEDIRAMTDYKNFSGEVVSA